MEFEAIVSVISTVGFPIAACYALFWKINKQDEQHQEELATLTKALENNTIAMNKLINKLDGDK